MRRIEAFAQIELPVEAVFDFLADTRNLPLWVPSILEVTPASEDPIQVGSSSSRIMSFGGRRSASTYVVTAYEPNRKFAVRTTSGPLTIEEQFAVEPAVGGTRVTLAEKVEARGIFKPAEWIFVWMAKKSLQVIARSLKAYLESRSSPTGAEDPDPA